MFHQHKLFYHENYEQEEYLMTEREGIDINMNMYETAGEQIENKSNKCLNLGKYRVKRLS